MQVSLIRKKLIRYLPELKGFKFVITLVLELKKVQNKNEIL